MPGVRHARRCSSYAPRREPVPSQPRLPVLRASRAAWSRGNVAALIGGGLAPPYSPDTSSLTTYSTSSASANTPAMIEPSSASGRNLAGNRTVPT